MKYTKNVVNEIALAISARGSDIADPVSMVTDDARLSAVIFEETGRRVSGPNNLRRIETALHEM